MDNTERYVKRNRLRADSRGSDRGRRRQRTTYFGKPCKRGHNGERYVTGHCVACQRDAMTRWMRKAKANNHPAIKKQPKYVRNYQQRHAEDIRNYQRRYLSHRRKTDVAFRLTQNIRSHILRVLRGQKKVEKTLNLLGVKSIEFYKQYLGAQFTAGMSWANYGVWHIDHIVPLSRFNLAEPSEQRLAFNHKNTRPLWGEQNKKRGNRLVLDDLLY